MISVIIPAYNSETTIVDCINSAINQSRNDLIDEIIVINDGSSDRTVQIIKKQIHNEKIKIISKSNGGVSSARNKGIRQAHGEWIALLDSDDVWLSQKIERQVEKIRQYPEINFIGTNRNKENIRFGKKVDSNLYKLNLRHVLLKNWPHTSTVLIRKAIFDEVGLFNETMKYAEDGDMWNRIVVKYPLYYIAESLEIAGGNKRSYGERGLSANLKCMYEGNVKNLIYLSNSGCIGSMEYAFWRLLFWIKNIRRICITKMFNLCVFLRNCI